jgi:hypothetical protein
MSLYSIKLDFAPTLSTIISSFRVTVLTAQSGSNYGQVYPNIVSGNKHILFSHPTTDVVWQGHIETGCTRSVALI